MVARQKSKPPQFSESLCTRQPFRAGFESVAQLDVAVVLKYLERDARVVIVQKNAVNFVEPEDAEAIAEGITRLDKIGKHLRRGSKNIALTYLRSKKQLEELLAKGLNTQETLMTVLNKIESAATEVEIMKAFDTSARMLRAVLQNPLLQQGSVDATSERMADVLADHEEIEDAISLGDDLAAISAGVPDVDDDKLKDELEMLIEEEKKEEDEEKERLGLGEKCKAEEKERARVEVEKKRKAKEDGETSGQEEE
ncbi:hypothetical protein FS837_005725, partial [Tulasnella sp. UAMH 9824]